MSNTCILCLSSGDVMTKEHIFPDAAGGMFSARILCKKCNESLGLFVDAPYLSQKNIQLARVALKLRGKSGKIPQPFTEVYAVEDSGGRTKVKLDADFKPKVIPQSPEIRVTKDGAISFALTRDASEIGAIPRTIRTSMERFFKTEEGARIGWHSAEQERATTYLSERAAQIGPISSPVQLEMSASWEIDFNAIYAEHVKVIFELCCIEWGDAFRDSSSGDRLRSFLRSRCVRVSAPCSYLEAQRNLNCINQWASEANWLLSSLTNNRPHRYHVAIVGPGYAACSMFGLGATFVATDFRISNTETPRVKAYICNISESKSSIIDLAEFFLRERS